MLCAISKSKLQQLSLCLICVLKTDLREENEQMSSACSHGGSWTSNIPLLSPTTFTCRHAHKQTQAPFTLKVFSCVHLVSHSCSLSLLLPLPVFLPLSFFTHPSISLLISLYRCFTPSFWLSIYRLYLSVSLLYTCAQTQTKGSHVGMHVQQICRWLCDSRDELLEQLHSSLIRWHMDANQNHNSLFLTGSPPPRGKGQFREKGLFYVIWVSPLVSQITKGSE